MPLFLSFLTIIFILAFAGSAPAYMVLNGKATILDGDTIEISGERIRLAGIDAPESKQPCIDSKNRPYRCGKFVAHELRKKIGGADIRCVGEARGRYGRLLAVCYLGEEGSQSMADPQWLRRRLYHLLPAL